MSTEEISIEDSESNDTPHEETSIETEKKELLSNVTSGNILTLKDKVGYILNRFSETRNSDIELAWKFWQTFESDKFDGLKISKSEMFVLTRANSLTRSRAKIQNEYKLFQADDSVKRHRGVLEEEKRNEAIEDKPVSLPSYTVFIDETGKNQNYLFVGSLWMIEGDAFNVRKAIDEWKDGNSLNYEFHFAELTRNKLDNYKEFFRRFIVLNPTIGFKIIGVRNTGFRDISQPITDLTFHLLNNGIHHENTSNRALLPRLLQVWLDEEEEGSDAIKLVNLKERILAQNIEGLYLDNIHTVSSSNNYFIQAVDLFTASVNRLVNITTSNRNHKDDLADYILNLVGLNAEEIDLDNQQVDNSVVFNLSNFNINNG